MTAAEMSGDDFPIYTRAEFAADRAVHVVGLVGAIACAVWLLAHIPREAGALWAAVIAVYVAGLVGMLLASAAYNLTPASALKAKLRRLDRSVIFIMIAGTYSPFALGLPSAVGVPLCLVVWSLAAFGITLEHAGARWAQRIRLPLYLIMGWLVVGILPTLYVAVGHVPFILLIAGGVVYSLGAALQAHGRLLFHNAVWHAMVIVGAGLHYAAIVSLLPR